MNRPSAIDTLFEAFTAVPAYDHPLQPLYEVLAQEWPAQSLSRKPLTLQALRRHTQLLHDCADKVQDQTFAVNKVIVSCKQIPPTPLPSLPLGF